MNIYKWLATIILLIVVGIPMLLWALVATESGSRFVANTAIDYLPTDVIDLRYDQLNGTLIDSFEIRDLTVNTGGQNITIKSLQLSWRPMALFDGSLHLTRLTLIEPHLQLAASANDETPQQSPTLPDVRLPLQLIVGQLRITSARLSNSAGFEQELASLVTSINYRNSDLELSQLQLQYQDIARLNSGSIRVTTAKNYPLQAQFNWQLNLPQLHRVKASTSVAGNVTKVTIANQLDINNQRFELTATLTELLQAPTFEAALRMQQVALAELFTSSPSDQLPDDLTGVVQASGSPEQVQVELDLAAQVPELDSVKLLGTLDLNQTQLVVKQLEVTQTKNGEENRLSLHGDINQWASANPELTISAQWDDLSYPAIVADAASKTGTLEVSGTLDNYQINLNHQLLYQSYSFDHSLQGAGSSSAFTIANSELTGEQGQLINEASVDWSGGLEASVLIKQASLQLAELNFNAKGSASYNEEVLTITNFELTGPDSQLTVNGTLGSDHAISWQGGITNLETYSAVLQGQNLGGSVDAKGTLSGDLQALKFQLDSTASDITYGALNFEQLALQLGGDFSDSTLTVNLNKFSFAEAALGNWQLDQATQLELPVQNVLALRFDDFCLQASSSSLCLQQRIVEEQNRSLNRIEVAADQFPLSIISDLLREYPARFFGAVDAKAWLTLNTKDNVFVASEGYVKSTNAKVALETQNQRVSFKEIAANWSADEADIVADISVTPAAIAGDLAGNISITDWQNTGALDGNITANFSDLSVFQIVIPQMSYESGSLVTDIDVGGTIDTPEFLGNLELSASQLGFTQLGLLLTELSLDIENDTTNLSVFSVKGAAQSSQGGAQITGQISPFQPGFDLKVEGENFRVVDTPKLTLDMSPDISAYFAENQLTVRGELTIPYARIEQPKLESTVSKSPDVEIYRSGERVTTEAEAPIPLDAKIRISLGDDVRVKAFGFDGRLTGSLQVTDDGKRPTTASGNIAVARGLYEIYGQELDIERGALIYTGGVISNPGLDLRVQREFTAGAFSDSVQVGAQIGGNLTAPSLRLFSNPAMPDSQILSYLILGRGPATESGTDENLQLQAAMLLGSQGVDFLGKDLKDAFSIDEIGIDSGDDLNTSSFFIGKHLSPRLYVKYGIGLLEPINTFFLRYQLTEQLQLESTSSTEAQGGDLIYVIEKD
ncbi:MAG: translocation/assembly module TamB domain-containing protein [Idiomarina sp.]